MQRLLKRVQFATETLLENERLTAGLDDSTAETLLNWGTDCATDVVRRTAGMGDAEAERAMTPGLRATRRLMRKVRTWATHRAEVDFEQGRHLLDELVAQALIIYPDLEPPSQEQRRAAIKRCLSLVDHPQQIIVTLRGLVEGETQTTTDTEGKNG